MTILSKTTMPQRGVDMTATEMDALLKRAAAKLNCKPHQVYDELVRVLGERQRRGPGTGAKVMA